MPWYDSIIYKSQAIADKWNPILEDWRRKYSGNVYTQTVDKFEVINFDQLFEENLRQGATLVPCGLEHESMAMGGSIDEIKNALFQSSDGAIGFVATCECGYLKGNYNIGQTCPKCKGVVNSVFSKEINIRAWLEIPDSLPPFLHPAVYRVLCQWMGGVKKRSKIIDQILDVDSEKPDYIANAIGRGGMWYFYNNFWDVIRLLANNHNGATAKSNDLILAFLEKYKDRLFCRHIPILNQSLHVLTHSGTMTYGDDPSEHILKCCIELSNTIYQQRHQPTMNPHFLDQHVFSTYKAWIDYTDAVIKNKIIDKTGFIRKCILGARVHMSARGVIVPITHEHEADEVELPWRMIVGLFKLEIIDRLRLKLGININEAQDYWTQAEVGIAMEESDPAVIHRVNAKITAVREALTELLAECPFKGFPIVMGRNP